MSFDRRPPLARVTAVELRKMVNTRSGLWVLIGVVAAIVLFAFVNGLDDGGRKATYIWVFHVASQPSAYLLPVLGVLLVSGEWTHRTALTTFTLVPVRGRVIAAKMIAGLLVASAALLVTVAVSVVFSATFGHAPGGAGSLPAAVIVQGWVHLAAWMLIGLAFGAAFLTSVPAIVAYLLLPLAWSGMLAAIHPLHGVSTWLGIASFNPLTLHVLSAGEWAHVAATMTLWIGLPLLVGLRRISHGELG